MAVTYRTPEIINAVRAVDSRPVRDVIRSLLEYATIEVMRIAPDAPDGVHNRAAIAIIGYLFDRPTAAREQGYANVLRNSGAGAMLLPYRVHRGGTTAAPPAVEAEAAAEPEVVVEEPSGPAALRIAWLDSRDFTAAHFTSSEAAVGDVSGVFPPDYPAALMTSTGLYCGLWIGTLDTVTNIAPNLGGIGAWQRNGVLGVLGVTGQLWTSNSQLVERLNAYIIAVTLAEA